MHFSKALVISLALLGAIGCTPNQDNAEHGQASSTTLQAQAAVPYIKGTGKSMLNQTITSPQGQAVSLIPSRDQHLTVLSLWCPAWFNGSNVQLQQLVKLNQEYAGRGVRIIVIAYDTPTKEISEAIKNLGITFEIGTGNTTLYDALEMRSIPTTWYLDSAGALVKTVEGFEPYEDMKADIEELCTKYGSEETPPASAASAPLSESEGVKPDSSVPPASAQAEPPLSASSAPTVSVTASPASSPIAGVEANASPEPLPTSTPPTAEASPLPTVTEDSVDTIRLDGKVSPVPEVSSSASASQPSVQ